jgi:hypothetical protein
VVLESDDRAEFERVTIDVPFDRVEGDWQSGAVVLRASDVPGDMALEYHYAQWRPDVDWEVRDGTLHLDSDCLQQGHCWVDLELTVPWTTEVDLWVISGPVELWNTTGDVSLDVQSGAAKLQDVTGNLVIDISSGGLQGDDLRGDRFDIAVTSGTVDLEFDDTFDRLQVAVTSGSVDLLVPYDTYACDVSVASGSESVSGISESATANHTIVVDVTSGSVEIRGY